MTHKDILKLLFPIELGGVFDEDITLEGQHLDTAQANAETLLAELFPDKTTELMADWERVYGIIPPPNTRQAYLSRNSPAYLADGSQVAADAPRYEAGKFNKGIMSEEGTTNLLTANQASVETDTTGYAVVNGATISRDILKYWHGTASLKIITPGSVNQEGAITTFISGLTPSVKHSASVWVQGTGTITLQIGEYTSADVAVGYSASSPIVLSSIWQRISVTRLFDATGVKAKLFILTSGIQAITFYADGAQFEQKNYLTSWQNPADGARANEPLSFPTAGILSPTAGSWAQWVDIADVAKRQVAGQYNRIFDILGTDPDANIVLFHQDATANWCIRSRNDAGAATDANIADSYTPNGWHRFLATWDAAALKLYIDGVLRATVSNPSLPSALAPSAYIGSNGTTYFLNAVHDDVQTWDQVLSETEAAADYARGSAGVPGADTTALFPFDTDLYSIDLVARRAAVVQKLRLRGSLTRQYFVDLAAAVGYTITIEEIPPNDAGYGGAWDTINIWKVHVPIGAKEITYFTAGDSGAGDLLTDWPSEDILENLFNDLKPAHTQVYFVYE